MHELSETIAAYQSLKKTVHELNQKLSGMEDEIKAHMGETEELSMDGYTVRWKKVAQNRFDTTAFRKQHTALYEQFLVRGETRRFTVT